MDLDTITAVRPARTRSDLAALGPTTAPLAGGSWLFSEPQDHLTGLLDLTTLGWPSVTRSDADLTLAATCTLAEVAALTDSLDLPAAPLFRDACTALYGSFKVWNVATIGGNICTSLPAGPMTSLAATLDAQALIWRGDGTDRRLPVADLVTGNRTNDLLPGEVLRAIEFPAAALTARTAYRKIALSPLGRSGAVVMGRRDSDGAVALTVTAATVRPEVLRYPASPTAAELRSDLDQITTWFTDAHGAADWRRAVSTLLAEQIRQELAA